MLLFIGRRVLVALPLLVFVSFVVFLLVHLAPGDAAAYAAGDTASPEQIAQVRHRLGLDRPFFDQYQTWLRGLLTGDLGTSLFSSASVVDAIMARLPVTVSLALGATVVALAIAVPAGIAAALRSDTWIDRACMIGASAGIAAPNFFVGLLLVLVFSHWWGLLPATQYVPLNESPSDWARHLIMPCVALGLGMSAELARHLRAALRDVLQQEHIRTAYAKGIPTWRVIGKHGLKTAAPPVVTVLGLQIRAVIGGAIVIETVFALPGIGSLAINAVLGRDLPMIQAITMTTVVLVVVVNLFVDLSYGYLDPRVRRS